MPPKICGIYVIINLTNGHLYIGSSVDVHNRVLSHKRGLRHQTHKNPKLQRAWNRDGEQSFAFLTLFQCDETVIRQLEGLVLQTCQPTYNLTMSVDGSTKLSEETKRKIGKAHKGIPKSAKHRRRIGEAHKGRPKSTEMRARLSASVTGRKHSSETKQKIGDALKGRVKSEAERKNIGEAQRGHKRNVGRRHTQKAKDNMSAARKRWWDKKREAKEIPV